MKKNAGLLPAEPEISRTKLRQFANPVQNKAVQHWSDKLQYERTVTVQWHTKRRAGLNRCATSQSKIGKSTKTSQKQRDMLFWYAHSSCQSGWHQRQQQGHWTKACAGAEINGPYQLWCSDGSQCAARPASHQKTQPNGEWIIKVCFMLEYIGFKLAIKRCITWLFWWSKHMIMRWVVAMITWFATIKFVDSAVILWRHFCCSCCYFCDLTYHNYNYH